MAESLDAALNQMFGGQGPAQRAPAATSTSTAPAPEPGGSPAPASLAPLSDALVARARQHYERAMQAQREGNWAQYGEEIRLLGDILGGRAK
jgi:uncharacterized membrane protein (UPF0182 family)